MRKGNHGQDDHDGKPPRRSINQSISRAEVKHGIYRDQLADYEDKQGRTWVVNVSRKEQREMVTRKPRMDSYKKGK